MSFLLVSKRRFLKKNRTLILLVSFLLLICHFFYFPSKHADEQTIGKKLASPTIVKDYVIYTNPPELETKKNFNPKQHQQAAPYKANDLFLDQELNKIYNKYKNDTPTSAQKIILPSQNRILKNKKEPITILEYTNIVNGHKYCDMQFGDRIKGDTKRFDYLDKCSYTNCIFSCNKSLVNEADALLMHLTDVESELNQNEKAKQKLLSINTSFIFQLVSFKQPCLKNNLLNIEQA